MASSGSLVLKFEACLSPDQVRYIQEQWLRQQYGCVDPEQVERDVEAIRARYLMWPEGRTFS